MRIGLGSQEGRRVARPRQGAGRDRASRVYRRRSSTVSERHSLSIDIPLPLGTTIALVDCLRPNRDNAISPQLPQPLCPHCGQSAETAIHQAGSNRVLLG